MRTTGVYMKGIGVFRPRTESVGEAVERGLVTRYAADASGITAVAVAGDVSPPESALIAAQQALKGSGLSADDIGLLLCTGVWHQGPDGWGPQYHLQRHLLGDDLLAVELRHGCNGTFSAMELAVPYLRSAPHIGGALITASDNFGTPLIDRWNPGEGLAYLGDGAGAVVLGTSRGFAEVLSLCTASFSAMEEVHRAGEPLFPPGATTATFLDYGARAARFQQKATDDGTWIQLLLGHQKHNVKCVSQALHEAGVEASDIKTVVTHSMPRQAAASYLKILGFSLERSTWEFSRTTGHLGAGDHLAALHHLLSTGKTGPGDHLLLCGSSPGVTYKAAVIRILDTAAFTDQEARPDGL
ncbi:ketoacyl-ACP synthase III family protein [Streptomyces flavofungini]|uniref:ketoacyl-ACP synthase III family protein n=1 Tax=Streptomyces flavofungini TaxID=68200 RepID=UPI0034DF6FE6